MYLHTDREKSNQRTISQRHRKPMPRSISLLSIHSIRHDKSALIQYSISVYERRARRTEPGRSDLCILSPVSITESGGVMSAVASVLPATELSMPFFLHSLFIDGLGHCMGKCLVRAHLPHFQKKRVAVNSVADGGVVDLKSIRASL